MGVDSYKFLLNKLHTAQQNEDKNTQIETYFKLSEYHYNNSDFEKAKLLLKNILDLSPSHPNVYYYLSLIEINKNNYEKAIKNLKEELKINPLNENAKHLKEKLTIKTNFPLITILLFVLNLITFIFTTTQISFLNLIRYGLSATNLNLVNAFTSLFFHINLYHFIFNMIVLVSFGIILEKYIGSIKFLTIYLISGIIGNIVQALFLENSIVLGSSAALFAILGSLMMREPLLDIRLFGIIKTPIILVLGGFFLFTFMIEQLFSNTIVTGDIAHYTGILTGILLTALFYTETIDIFYNWLFITFGFWLIEYSIKNSLIIETMLFIPIFYLVTIFTIGIIIITYSYNKLKKYKQIGGLKNESDN